MAYKRDIDDIRESPALDVMLLLMKRGARVTYSDPFIPQVRVDGIVCDSDDSEAACRAADCVVVITDHRGVDYKMVAETAQLIVDTRNVFKGVDSEKIVRL